MLNEGTPQKCEKCSGNTRYQKVLCLKLACGRKLYSRVIFCFAP